jgi:hypothetical protein
VQVSETMVQYGVSLQSDGDGRALVRGLEPFAFDDPLAYAPPKREFLDDSTLHDIGAFFNYGSVRQMANAPLHIRRFAAAIRRGDPVRFNVYYQDFLGTAHFIRSIGAEKPSDVDYWVPRDNNLVLGWKRWGP